jgi:hypothetical protein
MGLQIDPQLTDAQRTDAQPSDVAAARIVDDCCDDLAARQIAALTKARDRALALKSAQTQQDEVVRERSRAQAKTSERSVVNDRLRDPLHDPQVPKGLP